MMIKEAHAHNLEQNITFSCEDAMSLSYEDNSFDCVVIGNLLHIVPDASRVLEEAMRVLKDGGLIFVLTFVYKDEHKSLKLKIAEKLGFKTYRRFTLKSYQEYIESKGFSTIECMSVCGKPLDEGVYIGRACK